MFKYILFLSTVLGAIIGSALFPYFPWHTLSAIASFAIGYYRRSIDSFFHPVDEGRVVIKHPEVSKKYASLEAEHGNVQSPPDESIPIYALVKPNTFWIYKGHRLKVNKVHLQSNRFRPQHGRKFELSLEGTEFEKIHGYKYTYIYEKDLILTYRSQEAEEESKAAFLDLQRDSELDHLS